MNSILALLPYSVKTFVIGLGFMSGLWTAVGVDPESVITNGFARAADSMLPGSGILIWAIPILSLIVSLVAAYKWGQVAGIIAIALAFVGGLFLLASTEVMIVLTSMGVLLGLWVHRGNEA